MKKTLPVVLCIVATLICFPLSAYAFGIGLTPSTIELDVTPGSHQRQILKVKNFNQKKP